MGGARYDFRAPLITGTHGRVAEAMIRPIAERLAELRKEIAEIRTQNGVDWSLSPYQDRGARKQRREERLSEIMEELRSLNQWKQPSAPHENRVNFCRY
jgi:hypothetical protein